MTLTIVNPKLADALFKAGIKLVRQGPSEDQPNYVFVFEYEPYQSAIVRKIVNG